MKIFPENFSTALGDECQAAKTKMEKDLHWQHLQISDKQQSNIKNRPLNDRHLKKLKRNAIIISEYKYILFI
jgi:hypothetical protein